MHEYKDDSGQGNGAWIRRGRRLMFASATTIGLASVLAVSGADAVPSNRGEDHLTSSDNDNDNDNSDNSDNDNSDNDNSDNDNSDNDNSDNGSEINYEELYQFGGPTRPVEEAKNSFPGSDDSDSDADERKAAAKAKADAKAKAEREAAAAAAAEAELVGNTTSFNLDENGRMVVTDRDANGEIIRQTTTDPTTGETRDELDPNKPTWAGDKTELPSGIHEQKNPDGSTSNFAVDEDGVVRGVVDVPEGSTTVPVTDENGNIRGITNISNPDQTQDKDDDTPETEDNSSETDEGEPNFSHIDLDNADQLAHWETTVEPGTGDLIEVWIGPLDLDPFPSDPGEPKPEEPLDFNASIEGDLNSWGVNERETQRVVFEVPANFVDDKAADLVFDAADSNEDSDQQSEDFEFGLPDSSISFFGQTDDEDDEARSQLSQPDTGGQGQDAPSVPSVVEIVETESESIDLEPQAKGDTNGEALCVDEGSDDRLNWGVNLETNAGCWVNGRATMNDCVEIGAGLFECPDGKEYDNRIG